MAKAQLYSFLLVDSGKTEWDESGRLVGAADLPLSDDGTTEIAERLGSLSKPRLDAVFSGPDEGSKATASALAKIAGCKAKTLDDLAGARLGLWEGVLGSDLEERCPSVYKQWQADPSAVAVPEGEPLGAAADRITGAIEKALKKLKSDAPSVGLVLRPDAMTCVLAWLSGKPLSAAKAIQTEFSGLEWRTVARESLGVPRDPARVG